MVQPQQASGQQGMEQQAMALVQAAMQGDQKANQTIQKIMQAAQQGDQQAVQVAKLLQAIVQQMKGSRKARLGAKLDYIKQSIGECPEGQEVVYFKKGGEICKMCAGKKMQDGGKSDPIKEFKKKKVNKHQQGGTFNVVATKAPGFGDNQKDQLSDIATLTGATVISKDLGMQLKDMTMNDLGTCKKVIVEKDATTLIEGAGSKEAFKERISELESMLEKTTSDYDKKKLHERIAKLSNGVAVIKVGATTEAEMKDKKLRLEDALNATRAAIEEGIIIGGGACLANVSSEVRHELRSDVVDVQKGINIVLDSLTAPLYQIAENAGYDGDEIVKKQLAENDNVGFDAKNGKWVDMFEEGIVDPCKVTRSALLNAASVSGLLITTEAAVGTIKESGFQVGQDSVIICFA